MLHIQNKENRRHPLYSVLPKSHSLCGLIIFVIFTIGIYVYIITHISQNNVDLETIDHEAEMIENKNILGRTFQQIGLYLYIGNIQCIQYIHRYFKCLNRKFYSSRNRPRATSS